MAWIELHDTLPDHPKTYRLAKRLGVEIPTAIGHLISLFSWCIRFEPSGNLGELSENEVATASKFGGDSKAFMQALIDEKWLDVDERKTAGRVSIHNWEDYTRGFRKAEKDRERKKRARLSRTSAENPRNGAVDRTGPDLTGPDRTGPDHTGPEKPPAPAGEGVDFHLWKTWQSGSGEPINQKTGTMNIRRAMARGAGAQEIEAVFFDGSSCQDRKIWEVLDERWPEKKKPMKSVKEKLAEIEAKEKRRKDLADEIRKGMPS